MDTSGAFVGSAGRKMPRVSPGRTLRIGCVGRRQIASLAARSTRAPECASEIRRVAAGQNRGLLPGLFASARRPASLPGKDHFGL
jgi:hypothetical protein